MMKIKKYLKPSGPIKGRMLSAHPSTAHKDQDLEAWEAAQKRQAEMEQRRRQNEEKARKHRLQKAKEHDRKAERYKSLYSSVMSTLSDPSNTSPFTGNAVKGAAEQQRQEKLDKAHDIKKGIDATATAAELGAAGYGLVRGTAHLGRYMVQRGVNRMGANATMSLLSNLNRWNNMTAAVDVPLMWMNGIGGAADGYQWITANNSLDAWENGLETGANVAGVVGGTNWFRSIPAFQIIGGNKIDAILDGLGYSAAAWDLVKNLPPLSTYLDLGRNNSKKKAYGGKITINNIEI